MRIRTTYTVTPEDALADADLPIEVRVEDVTVSLDRIEDGLLLVVERPVDRSALEFVADGGLFWREADGTEVPIPTLKVPESELDTVAARDVLSALSFLSDTTLELSVRGRVDDDVVPDDAEDEALLERLGTRRRYRQTGATFETRTVQPKADTEAVGALLDRTSGVRIHAMALALGTSSARFRELWRVLEAAFQLKDNDLIQRLAEYGPVRQLGFDRDELRELHTLRGRASHAESRSGVHELEHVERECAARVARLKCLAERVILTKKSWGSPTTGIEELSPLLAYVQRDGGVVYVQHPAKDVE
jgi:hypothetical protein